MSQEPPEKREARAPAEPTLEIGTPAPPASEPSEEPARSDERRVEPPVPPPPRRLSVGPAAWGVTLVAVGVLWLLDTLGVRIPWEVVLPASVVAIGVALLATARTGAHGGLIGLGVVLTVLALMAAAVGGPLRLTVGERFERVTSVQQLRSDYGHGAGTLTLDLRDLDLGTRTETVRVGLNLGQLEVRLPDDLVVEVDARVRAGEVEALGRIGNGVNVRVQVVDPPGEPQLRLELSVGLGQIQVRR